MATREFERLEVRIRRLIYLTWLLHWFRKNETEIGKELEAAIEKGETWLPISMRELGTDLVRFNSGLSVTMLRTFCDESSERREMDHSPAAHHLNRSRDEGGLPLLG